MLKHLGFCALALVASSGIAVAGNGADLLKSIPETTQIVMVFDVAEARDSSLVESNFKKLLDSTPDAAAKLAQFGIDPMKDIDTLMFAGGGVTELAQMKEVSQMVFIVEGRLPKKMVDAAAVSRTKYRGIEVLSREDTDAAFVGKRLYFTKKGMMSAAIDVALGKGKIKSAAQSPKATKLRAAIASTNTKSDVWMVIVVPDKDRATMSQSGLAVDSMSVAVKLAADLAAVVRLHAASETSAATAVTLFKSFLPTLKSSMGSIGLQQAASTVTLSQDKAAVQATGTLSAGELSSLIAMAQGAPSASPAKPMPVTPRTSGGLGGGAKPAPAPPATRP